MNKGFSLVELIVVIAIMAILVGVAVPVYTGYIKEANEAKDIQAIDNLEHACKIVDIEYPSAKFTFAGPAESTTITLTVDNANAAARLGEILGTTLTEGDVDGTYVYTLTLATKVGGDVKCPASIN